MGNLFLANPLHAPELNSISECVNIRGTDINAYEFQNSAHIKTLLFPYYSWMTWFFFHFSVKITRLN